VRGTIHFVSDCADVLTDAHPRAVLGRARAKRHPTHAPPALALSGQKARAAPHSNNIPLRRGLRPGARRARLAWALKPHNTQEPDEPVKMNNERMLVRDANTGEMMEMCLKTGHLLKLGSPPSEDMRFPASDLRHKKPVPAHLRPKEVAPVVVTAPPPPADATPPPLPARVAAPTPPPPPSSESPASLPKSSVASTPAQSPRASARKRRGSLLDGVTKLLGKDTDPIHDLDAALGRLAKADLSAADKIALALKLRGYADWLDAATPRAASPAALVSTPAQDGFRYRFETSPGDAQKALHAAPRFPLTTPEFERQASTSPLPSPEVTAKVLDTVVEMSNDELVAAVRAEAVRRASSTEEAASSASDDDAPPRAVSPTLEAARPVSPIMSPAQTPAAVDVVDAPPPAVDAIRPIPDLTSNGGGVSRAASTKTATPQGHRVVTMSSGSVSRAPPPAEPAPPPPAVEPYRPTTTGTAMLDAIEADILNLETTLEAAPPADADEGLISFDATPDDEGFAAFETAPVATTPVEPTPAQKTSPFEAAIAARRARSEAQTDAQRPDPLAGARATTVI
jgi:hypothetical protein